MQVDEEEVEQASKSRKLPCYMYLNGCEKSSAAHNCIHIAKLICSILMLITLKLANVFIDGIGVE